MVSQFEGVAARESPRVVLITGAARRIGAEIAREFRANDWRVVIHCWHSLAEATALADELGGPQWARVIQGDLNQEKHTSKIVRDALQAFGRIDALVNNASRIQGDADLLDDADRLRLFQCNAIAPYRLSGLLCEELSQNEGSIINLLDTRVSTPNPWPGFATYTASKAALHAYTLASAKELAPKVAVNAVAPGMVMPFPGQVWNEAESADANSRSLLGGTATAGDIARAVYWLSQAGHVTGQVLTVDGGESFRW